MACIKNWWDKVCAWVEKIFDNSPDGAPREDTKKKEDKEEGKDKDK